MMPRPLGKVYLLSHLTEIVPAELWEQFLINMDFFELFRRKVSLLLLLFGIILAKMIEEYLICSVRILGCAVFSELWEQFLINVNFFELFRRKVSLFLLLFGIILAKMIEEYRICSVRILGCAIFYKC